MDQDTALSVTSVTMSEFSGVENTIQHEITHLNSVETQTHKNINVSMDGVLWHLFFFLWSNGYFDIHNYETQESSNTEINNTEEDDTCDTPIVNITEGI